MGPFSYCLNTSTIRPVRLIEKIKIAGRLGYDAIEPWNDELDQHLNRGGTIEEIRSALDGEGIRVVSMIALFGWTDADPSAYSRALDECRRRMDQAVRLGSPFIVASPPNEVVDLEFAAGRFGELMELGKSLGVLPSMEFLGFVDGVHDLASAKTIADTCGGKIVADVFHLLRGGGELDDLLTIPGDRLAIFHINDVPAVPPVLQQEDGDRVILGEGVADLRKVIANLHAIDYRGPLSLELFNQRLWQSDPVEVCRIGLDRMRALVEG